MEAENALPGMEAENALPSEPGSHGKGPPLVLDQLFLFIFLRPAREKTTTVSLRVASRGALDAEQAQTPLSFVL